MFILCLSVIFSNCMFSVSLADKSSSTHLNSELKMKSFYNTSCCWSNTWANQLFDQATARRFPSCPRSCSQCRAAAVPGSKNCSCLDFVRLSLPVRALRQSKSGSSWTQICLHCAVINSVQAWLISNEPNETTSVQHDMKLDVVIFSAINQHPAKNITYLYRSE